MNEKELWEEAWKKTKDWSTSPWGVHKYCTRLLLEAKAEALQNIWKSDGWVSTQTGQPARIPT